MSKNPHATIVQCLQLILRPVVRFCLNRSLGLQDLIEAAKVVFLEVASEDLGKMGQKVTISRLNAVTGVDRRAAVRILREGIIKDYATQYATRTIGQWRRDRRYLTASGRPRVLTFKGDDSEFHRLVRRVSTSIHPKSVLFDLQRIGAVEETAKGLLRLKAYSYIPKGNPVEGFKMLAEDAEDLMMAVVDNIYSESDSLPNYHAAAVFNNISAEDVPKIRSWFYDQCSRFHLRVEKYLSKFDLDINPNKGKEGGKRISMGIYTRT